MLMAMLMETMEVKYHSMMMVESESTTRFQPNYNASFTPHKALFELALGKAGSSQVSSLHLEPTVATKSSEISALDNQEYGALHHGIFTAHQMGGPLMGRDATMGVVNDQYRHHRLKNLFVVDGLIFLLFTGSQPVTDDLWSRTQGTSVCW